jgi:hypothetical protein
VRCRTQLREAAKKLDFSSDRGKALEAWLESTRAGAKEPADTGGSLQKEVPSSIERV